ncbi:MAG: FAD-dependent oxidoreductase, partial [Fidelibacterota bacterium]
MEKPVNSSILKSHIKEGKLRIFLTPDHTGEYVLHEVIESPCTLACPARVNVKGYVSLIAEGKFQEALDLVRRRNPLPGICGRVCTHPCEIHCKRGEIDNALAICWLSEIKPAKITRKKRVAVIGSGPCGLTAAMDLVGMGYPVTVFEALEEPGGMLYVGIPSFRLPREIIKAEADRIISSGVEVKTGVKVGEDITINDLFKQGFKAIFIAIGAHKGRKLGIPGEDYKGCMDCVSFLKRVNLGDRRKPGDKVIVIGGGSSAVDSARTALRLGCREVTIVYRRSRKEMPAVESEVEEAEREGVKIQYLTAPVNISGGEGKVKGMRCIKMKLGEPDSSGRRRP